MIQRMFFNVLSKDVAASKAFYVNLLDMKVHFDSDWFVILKPQGDNPFELGIVDVNHEIVPVSERASPTGCYPCFVVDDVDVVHQRALASGVEIIEPPREMFYGQKRLLIRDPDGMMVDISSPSGPPPA